MENSADKSNLAKQALRDFVETAPLYVRNRDLMPLISDAELSYDTFAPRVVDYWCPVCERLRLFRDPSGRFGPGQSWRGLDGIHVFRFRCGDCEKQELHCWVQISEAEGWIQKVGQAPSPRVEPPDSIREALGEDLELYRKARVSQAQGYGIAACVYLRRILETHMNVFLDFVLVCHKEMVGSEPAVKEIQDAIADRTISNKATVAWRYIPSSMHVDGANPFKSLHDFVSRPIHELSEDDALLIASEIMGALEYTVLSLDSQRKSKEAFKQRIRSIDSQRGRK
jgi:hypothetical protein